MLAIWNQYSCETWHGYGLATSRKYQTLQVDPKESIIFYKNRNKDVMDDKWKFWICYTRSNNKMFGRDLLYYKTLFF